MKAAPILAKGGGMTTLLLRFWVDRCIPAVGSLAEVDSWSITNVAAFLIYTANM